MRRAGCLLALLALGSALPASQTVYPAASQGGSWLNLPFSSRAASLAGLGGDGQGVDALSYNPAGLASTQDYELSLYQDYWLQDADSQRLGLALPLGPGGLGLAFDNVNFGGVDLYSVNSLGQLNQQGTTYPEAWSIQAGYGLQAGPLSLGAALKGLSQNLGGQMENGYGLDLGSALRLGAFGLDLSVLQAAGELGGGALPLNADLEGTYEAWRAGNSRVDLMAGAAWLPGDASTSAALGAEVQLSELLALRAGYRTSDAQSAGGWAAGLGVRPLAWLGVDYAYNSVGGLQATNQLTLNVYWDRWWARSRPESAPTTVPSVSPEPGPSPAPEPIGSAVQAVPAVSSAASTPGAALPSAASASLPQTGPGSPTVGAASGTLSGTAAPARATTPVALALIPARPAPETAAHRAAYSIVALAGAGTSGYSGDGGSALTAELNGPLSVAVDQAGDVFIADEYNQRIRKVDASGTISTVAGTGRSGCSGDGASAMAALLNYPAAVAVDLGGDLFIADSGNNRVRKVDPSGIISTVAGNGFPGYRGDGGPATEAELSNPVGLAVDSGGDLFISDSGNKRVRKVDPSGDISTAAADLSGPVGVAVDPAGDLFIADSDANRVLELRPSGILVTVAGSGEAGYSGDGGAAVGARLHEPSGVAVDAANELFISDSDNYRIRKVDAAGNISTVAVKSKGKASRARTGPLLDHPAGLAVDASGRLVIADYGNQIVRALK